MVDETLLALAAKTKAEFKKKYNKDISVDRIIEIFKSQFKDFVYYSEHEETMKIDFLGTFTIKEGRKGVMLNHPNYNKHYNKMKEIIGSFDDGTEITEL